MRFSTPAENTHKRKAKFPCNFVKSAYLRYFRFRLFDQDRAWTPHQIWKTCTEYLQQWGKGLNKRSEFHRNDGLEEIQKPHR